MSAARGCRLTEPSPPESVAAGGDGRLCGLQRKLWPAWAAAQAFRGSGLLTSSGRGDPVRRRWDGTGACRPLRRAGPRADGPPRLEGTAGGRDPWWCRGRRRGVGLDVAGGGEWPGQAGPHRFTPHPRLPADTLMWLSETHCLPQGTVTQPPNLQHQALLRPPPRGHRLSLRVSANSEKSPPVTQHWALTPGTRRRKLMQ